METFLDTDKTYVGVSYAGMAVCIRLRAEARGLAHDEVLTSVCRTARTFKRVLSVAESMLDKDFSYGEWRDAIEMIPGANLSSRRD